METKKVIEQDLCNDLQISYDDGFLKIEYDDWHIYVQESKRTEVAKALCPKYQQVEDELKKEKEIHSEMYNNLLLKSQAVFDQNAKLLEALKYLMEAYENPRFFNYEELQKRAKNSKKIIQQSETK